MKKTKIRARFEEWTLGEYEKIHSLIERAKKEGENYGWLDCWENILAITSDKKISLDELTPIELLTIKKDFETELEKSKVSKFKRVIEVEGLTFEAFEIGSKFKLNAKHIQTGERIIKSTGVLTFSQIMAIILTERNEDKEKRLSFESISKKSLVLENMKANEALPFLTEWSKSIGEITNFNLQNATE